MVCPHTPVLGCRCFRRAALDAMRSSNPPAACVVKKSLLRVTEGSKVSMDVHKLQTQAPRSQSLSWYFYKATEMADPGPQHHHRSRAAAARIAAGTD